MPCSRDRSLHHRQSPRNTTAAWLTSLPARAQAHWVVHQWRLYKRSLCSLLDTYSLCCGGGYALPEYAPLLLPRRSPPPAHL
ncbi:unnamed protein product [Plutella xylostella]|uniref:(diamondback moth) hypothetical protein n=1 Tax=Plutella xylostella TaxID=51655 RepID=A0A8S4DW24_PLUXY|nr:unnamed protein product [Plutella xylostella]